MQGKLSRRSRLRAAVESIVRSLVPSTTDRSAHPAARFCVEPLEERQMLTLLTIAQENALTGSPVSAWNVADGGAANLNGFTTDISVNQGGTVSFKVDDKNLGAYSISIFRLGYYQGLGARQITTIASPTITAQPAPITDSTGLIDCGNWSVSATWNVPSDATSGLYIADLIRGGAPVSQMPFVVRDDTDHSAILYQTSDSTWEAYNSYGGNSLYESTTSGGLGDNDDGNTPRAFSVSYNRPFVNRGENEGPQEGYIFGSEYPMIRFLEQNGYDVSYATDVDTARYASHLLDHRMVLTSGHDEYWSPEQRTNMTAARDAGVNMALFAGNEMFWKTRWQASSDSSHTNWRTIVCYKETLADAKIDPTSDFTGLWRDPRFPSYFPGNPENAFDGTISTVNGVRNDALSVSYPDSLDRFWRNSTVASLTNGQTKTFPAGTLGYEWDEDWDNGYRPAGLIDMSHTTLDVSPKYTLNYAGDYGAGTATHSITLYRAPSGALVFSAGETQWAWGLDTNHDRIGGAVQPAMQQATINLLADMGAQPSTLMSGLVAATASTDHTAPVSTISAPTPNATFTNGVPVTISGTATDSGGGIVAGVEISTDNGVTWHKAVGTNSWTYTWTPLVQGNVRILSRATDDSANIETVLPTRGVVVSSSGPFSVFPTTMTPQTAATTTAAGTTLGTRFMSDIGGQITGIRFYKGTTNTGTHIGSLWSNSGTLLASATFTGESGSGWQQVNFSTPVTIQAGVTYVASYFAPNGHYFGDDHGLGRNVDAGPLHILADGYNLQGDGIFTVANSNSFPTTADEDTNFFVDVVFQQPAGDTTRPTVIGQTPASGPASAPVNSVSITFSESIELPTLSFTLTGPGNVNIPATVAYASGTHIATLTPTSPLAAGTAYAVRATAYDLALNSLATPFTFSFTTPQNYSLWTTSTTPTNTASATTAGIELGVRFKSDVAGFISGLLFYKGAGNTGTHIGDLWSNSGSLLASATFSGESGSGWQTVTFASPVAITAGTTYVASYYAPNGHYASDSNYFNVALDNAPLHAPADGAGGFANGVSIATSTGGVFPTASAGGTNFWVDVVLTSGNVDTTPPIVASTTPASGTTGVSLTAPITATFDGPISTASLVFTLKGPGNVTVPGTVTYNAGTYTATFTPSSLLGSGAGYTASISATDSSGNAMASPYAWSFTTVPVPVVVARTPAVNKTGVAETSPITVTFNEGILNGSLVFTLTGPGNVSIPATVSYDPTTLTATLQPTSPLTSSTSYTASVTASDQSGNPMPAPATWSFTTAAVGTTFTLFPPSAVPTVVSQSDASKVELGMRFISDGTGFITGVRFYKGSTNTGTHIGNLWTDSGTLLATATFSGETASGWQQVLFNNPVAVTAGTTYVVSYVAPVGRYSLDTNYFATQRDNSPLHGPVDGANGDANGVYIYLTAAQTSKFPVNTNASSNYWVDAVFMTSAPPNQVTGASAAAGPNQNVLSWSAATRAVTYTIYRGTTAGGESATPIATGLTTLTYTDTGLTPGTAYFYKITAVDPAGESARSAEVSATPVKASPVFSGITSATITYGASTTTLSGVIAAGTQIPSGNVSITINGVTVLAAITAGTGAFSVAFDTHAIPASGTAYVVTYSFAANANFNAVSDTTHTLTINKRTLNATATGVNRIYDGSTTDTITFSDDRINGDVVTYTYAASFANKNVANGKAVSVTGIAISGAGAGNYTLASTTASTTANITPRTLTVSATGVNRVYNATTVGTVTLSDNRVSGDVLTLAYGAAAFSDKNAGTGKSLSVSGITVTGTDSGNYTFNTTATASANITPFALTVTATGVNKVYDSTTSATVTLGSNRFAGDTVTLGYGIASYADKNVATGKAISVSGITVTGIDSGNYTFNTTATASANITPFALAVTATGVNKVYDGLTTASVTLGDNRFAGDALTVGFGSAAFADKNAAAGKAVSVSGITVTGTDAGNYSWNATASTTASITPRALAISATGQTKIYDGSTSATVTLSDNRVSGDTLTTGYGTATFVDKNAGTGKAISVSGITLLGTDAANYTFNTTATTTGTISQRALAVTATASGKTYDGTTAATATLGDNRVSGDALTITYGSALFSDKNAGAGKTVTVTGISVSGTDAANYTWNSSTTATATISTATLTITASGSNKVYDGSTTAQVTLGDNRISGDALTITPGSATFSDKNVAAGKTISVTGIVLSGNDAANYTYNTAASTTAAITARALTVTATGQNKAYDQSTTAAVTLGDNRVSGDTLTLAYTSATFADKNAATGKAVSVSGITVTGADANNYTFNSTASTTATITPIALVVSATGGNRTYDGTTAATVTLGDNRLAGDVLTLGYTSASFADKNVANGKTISVSGITVTGTDAGNYTFNTTASASANITPFALTIGAVGQNKVYDQGTSATVTLTDNRVSGDALTITYSSATFADKNVANGKTVSVTGTSVAGADATNYTFNTSTTTTANITPLALTITVTAQSKAYDGSATATINFGDNRKPGDVLSFGYGSATFADKNAGLNKTVTVTGITLGGTDAANYTFNTSTTTTASISTIALTVGATASTKVYDSRANASVTLTDNRIASDALTITFGSATFSDKNVGTNKLVTVSGINVTGADSINYTFNTSTTAQASITPAALLVGASAANRVYTGGTAATGVTLSDNRVAGDSLTLSFTSATFADKNAGVSKTVSVTGINVTGTDAGNYTFNTTATTSATITPFALTVTATGATKVYDRTGIATVTLGDNRISGDVLTVGYGSASFADKLVGVNKPVSVSGITVTGTDAANYTFNASASTTGTITPYVLTVTAIGQNRVYDGTASAVVTLDDNHLFGDTITTSYSSATFANKTVANGKVISVSGITIGGADGANYTSNATAAAVGNITPFALTVAATGANKVYDRTTGATVTLSDNRIAGDVLTLGYGSAAFADKNAGVGKQVSVAGIAVTGADAANYTFNTTASTSATITPFALTVTANGTTKVYDRTGSATVTLSDNRLSGDVLTLGYGSASFADKLVGANKPVNVSGITVTGTDASNYTFNTSASTTGTITPYVLTITAIGQNRVYDGTTNAVVTLNDNHLFGDTVSITYGSASFANKNVGNSKSIAVSGFTIGGADGANYTSNATAIAAGNITPFALTVSATGATKVYDRTGSETVTLSDNRFSGDVLTLGYGSASFTDKLVGVNKPVSVSGITVSGTDASNYTFNTSASTTGTITPYVLNVTAIGQSKAYDGTTATAVTLNDNHLFGDTVTVNYGSAAFVNKNVGNGKSVTVSGFTFSGPDAGNYTSNATATAIANITPQLVVSGTASSDTLRLMLDASGPFVDWFLNGTAAIGQLAVSDVAGLTMNAGAAGMTINLDRTNGNPLPALVNLNGVFTLNGLQGADPLAGTTLNINRSTIYVTYADAAHDPINGIRNDIHTGYNAGAWTGTGSALVGSIHSANAAADGTQTTGIGYVDSTSGLIAGQPANSIKLKFTLYGDTGLAGTVGFTDFMRMTQHYTQNSGATWTLGDFDYDGAVGASDFTLLSRTYNMSLPAGAPDPMPVAAPTPVVTPSRPVVTPAPVIAVSPKPVVAPTPTPVVTPARPAVAVAPAPVVTPAPAPAVVAPPAADAKKKADKKTKVPVTKVELKKPVPTKAVEKKADKNAKGK